MRKTIVIDVVALTRGFIGHMPFLNEWSMDAKIASIGHVLPSVTCSVQATYATGKWPGEHGIVANGWYFRDVCEVRNWHQSANLVEAPKIWEVAKAKDPTFTCANIGWWFAMNGSADYVLTPRPQYLSDGRKLPDCYTVPMKLRNHLNEKLGTFPLFNYWGPNTSLRSSRYIAQAAIEVDKLYDPTLTLVYLPHLDYNTQRHGPQHTSVKESLTEIDQVLKELVTYFEGQGAQAIILSEYAVRPVEKPVHINRVLRQHGYISVREERGTELLDLGTSKAFAVSDHQVAHIYINDSSKVGEIKCLLESIPGVSMVLDADGKRDHHIDHDRAGELVAVADANAWFTYYYWLEDSRAPDFARMVEIHKKPGFDPAELFIDPNIKYPKMKVVLKLLKKKVGFRTLLDVIPLDANLVKGSHGAPPEPLDEGPIILSKSTGLIPDGLIPPVDIFGFILSHLFGVTK